MLSGLSSLRRQSPSQGVDKIVHTSKGEAASPSRRGMKEQAGERIDKEGVRKSARASSARSSSRFWLLLAVAALAGLLHWSSHPSPNNISATTQRTLTTSTTTSLSNMSGQFVLRKSNDRGLANHGWLKSYHSFSFAGYYDPRYNGYGPLRVINEDRVAGGEGFDMHPHSNYEIFSYVISGALLHEDSMKHKEIIKRGAVQHTSAGTGIAHAEFNANDSEDVRFLQVWIKPRANGLKPSYCTKVWSDADKTNVLKPILTPTGEDDAITIQSDSSVFASILEKGNSVAYTIPEGRKGYIHLTLTGGALDVNGVAMTEGDGAFVTGPLELSIQSTGKKSAEFLLFDLPPQ